jgi:hypothetical protein
MLGAGSQEAGDVGPPSIIEDDADARGIVAQDERKELGSTNGHG